MPTSHAFLDWQEAEDKAASAAERLRRYHDAGLIPPVAATSELRRLRSDAREKLHNLATALQGTMES